jgi:hypothetical protein
MEVRALRGEFRIDDAIATAPALVGDLVEGASAPLLCANGPMSASAMSARRRCPAWPATAMRCKWGSLTSSVHGTVTSPRNGSCRRSAYSRINLPRKRSTHGGSTRMSTSWRARFGAWRPRSQGRVRCAPHLSMRRVGRSAPVSDTSKSQHDHPPRSGEALNAETVSRDLDPSGVIYRYSGECACPLHARS